MAETVEIIKRDGENMLFFVDGKSEPEPCYVQLDLRDGELWAGWELSDDPAEDVKLGYRRIYKIPPLSNISANQFLYFIKRLAQEVLDCSEVRYDGKNFHATVNTDGLYAEELIRRLAALETSDLCWVQAKDWFAESRDYLADRLRQGETVSDLVKEYSGNGYAGEPVIIGLVDYLQELSESL
jgi:hypothetical protein